MGTVEFIIDSGDRVAARKETPQGVIPLEFTVTEVGEGGVLGGSPLGALDPADGWTFELLGKDDPELPDTLSDLAVWTIHDRATPVRCIGPVDGIFRTAVGGLVVPPATVLGWIPWEDYTPPPAPVITVPVDHPDVPHSQEVTDDGQPPADA